MGSRATSSNTARTWRPICACRVGDRPLSGPVPDAGDLPAPPFSTAWSIFLLTPDAFFGRRSFFLVLPSTNRSPVALSVTLVYRILRP